ncbi:hypothetical protein [Streptomyces sp. NPDC048269]|uniref:hypothetical protein n=1 Tax=Streptomyces sp. NPDC048269 TaxID=3155753 RepID=UPI0034183F81
MASTRTRRLAPLIIAPLIAAGGISLTTTAHAAPTTATGVPTEDKPRPGGGLLAGLTKAGALSRIGPNTANGGDTEPPAPSGKVYKIGRISVVKRVDIPKGSGPIMTDGTHEGGGGNVPPPDPGHGGGGAPSPKPDPGGTDDGEPRLDYTDTDTDTDSDSEPDLVLH